MDFKVGDVVRIKGGVDEWEIIDGSVMGCISIKLNNAETFLHPSKLELVRRKEEEKDVFDDIKIACSKCGEDMSASFRNPPKKRVERWLWAMKNSMNHYYNCYLTDEEAEEFNVPDPPLGRQIELIGKDPNCKEPLVTDE